MRIRDFLGPYLDGISGVVECHSGSFSLQPYLSLPDGVSYERAGEERRDDASDVLVLGLLGPDPERYGQEDEALTLLAGLAPGQRGAIAFAYPTPALPVHRLLDALAASGSQLVQVSSLEHQHLSAAAMAVQVGDRLATPRDPFGTPLVPEPGDALEPAALRRLANEFVLLDFVARNLRAQVFRLGGSSFEGPDAVRRRDELERWTEQARAQAEQSRSDAEAAKADAQAARAEAEAAQAEVDALRREATALRAEVDRLAASTSFLLGHRLVEAAKHPASTARLPVDLVRLWRQRGKASVHPRATRPSPTRAPVAPAALSPPVSAPITAIRPASEDEQRRFVAQLAFEAQPRIRPLIAGILSDATTVALQFDATVNRLEPNAARLVVERSEPDILVVESAAFGPGRPWSYAGDAAATDRTARLLEVIDQVHDLGGRAVLIRNTREPASAGLIPLESRFDVVLDAQRAVGHDAGWSRGVQLARFNPLGRPASLDPRPLFVGGISARDPLPLRAYATETMASMADLDLDIRADPDQPIDYVDSRGWTESIAADWLASEDAPSVYRARAVGLANPVAVPDSVSVIEPRILEQLACGMRLVSGPNLALAAAFGADVPIVRKPSEAAAAVRKASRQNPRSLSEMRGVLRTLFAGHATPVMLSALTRRFPSIADPLSGRMVAAVVIGDRLDRAALIELLIHQALRPAEVLGSEPEWSAPERATLEAAGIRFRALEHHGGDLRWSGIASVAEAEWLTIWPTDRPVGSCYLLDLVVGAELSKADVVGYGNPPLSYADRLELQNAVVRRTFAWSVLAGQPLRGDHPITTLPGGRRPVSVGPEELVP